MPSTGISGDPEPESGTDEPDSVSGNRWCGRLAGGPDHEGPGFGVLANIGIGIVGSFIGGFLFRMLQLSPSGRIGELVTATVGAVLLLAVVSAIKKA